MCGLMRAGYEGPGRSPDRADALVWALSRADAGQAARVAGVRALTGDAGGERAHHSPNAAS